jgi:ribonuclease HI
LRLPGWRRPQRVYVDAKILNMHDPNLKREAYVGYIVEGKDMRGAKEVDATESDDAEVLAILYAIERLKDSLGKFTIVCDHESVVSEANRETVKDPSDKMAVLRKVLQEESGRIVLEVLKANPAHGIVTEYVNSLKAQEPEPHE